MRYIRDAQVAIDAQMLNAALELNADKVSIFLCKNGQVHEEKYKELIWLHKQCNYVVANHMLKLKNTSIGIMFAH